MQGKKTWEPEAVLALLGGLVAAYCFGNLAAAELQASGVRGFRTDTSVGLVLVATLCFHGTAIVAGTWFLKFHETGWREILGGMDWKRAGLLAGITLVAVAPVVLGLKTGSEWILEKLRFAVKDQEAVDMVLHARLWVRVYLAVFAVVLAPLAEEFVFRGLLFSLAQRLGRPKLGWIGVSLLFALIHLNAPIFLPLFTLGLALTWLRETTGGLLAPVIAHGLFNFANLVLLFLAEKYNYLDP